MKDRLLLLKEFIDKNGKVTLHELECAFPNVSSMTLRRDLNRLEEDNAIIRISGGAISVNTVLRAKEADFSERINYNTAEKLEIADKAVKIVEPNSCVFIDGGSTTTYFARALPDDNFYVLTNALVIAETILRKEKPTVALLGGDLRKNTFITVGQTCADYIDKINIQTAVMTATGFIKETGVSLVEISLKQKFSAPLLKRRIALLCCLTVLKLTRKRLTLLRRYLTLIVWSLTATFLKN
jgi:DeoR/GlpR family transcriptional regulator of sugar metabolism